MEFICSVCLDNLFSENNNVSVTQCGHMYHKDCLENSMKTNKKCPNCQTRITRIVKKIFPDGYDELSYNSCTSETKEFLEDIFDNQREQKTKMIEIIKKLDKDNASLKETNRSYKENLKTSKVFLSSFEKEVKNFLDKNKELELRNNDLTDEKRKFEQCY